VRALAAPTALAGWSSPAFADVTRAALTDGFGAARARADLEAAGSAIACALTGAVVLDDGLACFGHATALALDSAAVRKAVLADGKQAARAARLSTACEALRLALTAAAAHALAEGGSVEDAREALDHALGVALPDEVSHALLRLPWPDGGAPRSRLGGLLARLERSFRGAQLALHLRERFDDRWPLQAAAWAWLAQLSELPPDERSSELDVDRCEPAGFVEHAGELL
jgi:hypothetical protein